MKNKKGFTLVEMIGVVVLLSAIALIVYPVVTGIIKNQKEKAYQIQIKKVEDAVELYAQEHCNTIDCNEIVSINQLKEQGYLKSSEVTDPRNNAPITKQYEIKYDEVTKKVQINEHDS